jgi:hypothetical protein
MKTEPVVMYDSPEAAKQVTVTGWVSRRGIFYGDNEHIARWDGCTHKACEGCGLPCEKSYIKCRNCREKADIARWEAMPKKAWDGAQMIFCDATDHYYSDPEGILEYCEDEGVSLADMRPILCEPNYAREVDSDYWTDELPEDEYDLPEDIETALAALNKAIREHKEPLSWGPGKFALDVSAYSSQGERSDASGGTK